MQNWERLQCFWNDVVYLDMMKGMVWSRKTKIPTNDRDRFINMSQVLVREIDKGQRLLLDYSYGSTSRLELEKQLSWVALLCRMYAHASTFYLNSLKNVQ